jgi:hypothetical protein
MSVVKPVPEHQPSGGWSNVRLGADGVGFPCRPNGPSRLIPVDTCQILPSFGGRAYASMPDIGALIRYGHSNPCTSWHFHVSSARVATSLEACGLVFP